MLKNAKKWLDDNYPQTGRNKATILDLSNKNLKGELDLSDFVNLEELDLRGNPQLENIKLAKEWKGKGKGILLMDAQEWLKRNYSDKSLVKKIDLQKTKDDFLRNNYIRYLAGNLSVDDYPNLEKININEDNKRSKVNVLANNSQEKTLTKLGISNCLQLKKINASTNKLTILVLVNLPNLEELNVNNNQLTNLDLRECPNLKKLDCSNNLLNQLDLSNNSRLEYLDISNNFFSGQNLSWFAHLVNCQSLQLMNGKFTGSLEPLKSLTKLKLLDISHNSIDGGLEYLLSNTIKVFNYQGVEAILSELVDNKINTLDDWKLIENWQLANPHLMNRAWPELFEKSPTKEKWNNALEKWKLSNPHLVIDEDSTLLYEPKERTKMLQDIENLLSKTIDELVNGRNKSKKEICDLIREWKLIKELIISKDTIDEILQTGIIWYNRRKEDKEIQTEKEEVYQTQVESSPKK